MSRSMLCTALLVGTIATLAVVMMAFVTGSTNVLANRGRTTDSPIVSTHESSGIELPSGQTRHDMLAAPNYTLDGPGAVSPDPYHPVSMTSCTVPYQSTAGSKTVLKYGTLTGCSTEDAPQHAPTAGTNA